MTVFLEALREHRAAIDSLNVFPVPDGDTGTNLLTTQGAVVAALRDRPLSGGSSEAGLREVGLVVADAALLGARGNSGVILSQILRGFSERLPDRGPASAGQIAGALEHAAEQAHRAVAAPVEGTMLSVIRGAAIAAAGAAARGSKTEDVLAEALEAGRAALAETAEINPELRRAGVVDAGGKGLVLLLDSLLCALTGSDLTEPVAPPGPVGAGGAGRTAPGPSPPGYEVQFLLRAGESDLAPLRSELARIGDSLVVVGGGGLFNVHVHTERPGRAIEAAVGTGPIRNLSVEYLRTKVDGCVAGQARAVRVGGDACALVAVVEGPGVIRTLESLGASVAPARAGVGPEDVDLVRAIERAPADAVLLLTGDPTLVPAMDRAAARAGVRAQVVAARSVPAAIAAGAAFNPVDSAEVNLEAMREAAAGCRAGAVEPAEEDAETTAGSVPGGEWVGTVDGEKLTAGRGILAVLSTVVGSMVGDLPDAEVLTLVVGEGVPEALRCGAVEVVKCLVPHLQLEVVDGGPPRNPFILGLE